VLKTGIIQKNDQDGWNSSDYCSEFDNRRFEDCSGQGIPSISQIVGEGTTRHMLPTTSRPTTYESENFETKFSLKGGDCYIPGLEVIK
jgi:hypothetical protein